MLRLGGAAERVPASLGGRTDDSVPESDGAWLHMVFLLAIFLGTVILVLYLAGRAINMMDRDG